ncbi:MAG TPA: nodulation protein NfeD [Thermoanaerobaculia bacterium]|nr:nodulation protein NfeD [Thermoanaerobaculia bacterium]
MKQTARHALLLLAFIATSARGDVLRVTVDGVIHAASDEFVGRALARAEALGADAVLLELRTPGGMDESTRSMVARILRSRVPVIVYVTPSGSRAASAGFFILQAADIAAMAPGTNTGASHPVLLGEKADDVMKTKMVNDAAAFMRSLAQKRRRNVLAAESAVRESKSFTEDEALAQRLIDVVAANVPSLLKAIDGRTIHRWDGTTTRLRVSGRPVQTFEMSLKQRVLSWIMDPNVAFILLSLGVLALWAEFNHPGAIVPGVVGVICLLLGVFALNLLPTRYAAVALLLAAFILFALEAKFATHGILAIGGIACMVFGALFLVDTPIPEMRVSLVTALLVSVPLGVIAVFLMGLVLKSRGHRVTTGTEGMVGEIGIARTAIAPEGKVFVHGEIWNAVANAPVEPGARVRVSAVDGLRLMVEAERELPAQAPAMTTDGSA